MTSTDKPLSWGLVVATYNREHILPCCVHLAIEQTRPPAELVIVDASPSWKDTRRKVLALDPQRRGIHLLYVEAERISSAAQRNQGVRLATADILFLIDDDSLMYRDCAEQILRIYEADADRVVAGVSAMHAPQPPDRLIETSTPFNQQGRMKKYSLFAKLIRTLLRADDLFVPYDIDFPRHSIPSSVGQLPIGTRELMAGWGMTFRRDVCLQEPFAEVLSRYAAGEDSDMSYRASRHGLLLTALQARLCHVSAPGGRLEPYAMALLGNLNPIVLHRLYSTDLARSRRRLRRLLARRFLIFFCKDLANGRLSLPNARGLLAAWRWLGYVFSLPAPQLREWYRRFQDEHATQ